MKTSDFEYTLPNDFIAQKPAHPRDSARLLVLDRKRRTYVHTVFREISRFLIPGDLLVLNQTRVIPARLTAYKHPSGGRVEILLLTQRNDLVWEALIKGKRIYSGQKFILTNGLEAEVTKVIAGARKEVRFGVPIAPLLRRIGEIPLPPYIKKPMVDTERYQTVYADRPGSAAAPTAGLHFTQSLLAQLASKGVNLTNLILHIGADTFVPIYEENLNDHPIHKEWCHVPIETVETVTRTKQNEGRIIAVGTTSVRALETAALSSRKSGGVREFRGLTDLFIRPGFNFQVVDVLVTNFHLPRSTLLMLVSAFAGRDFLLKSYEAAVAENYNFYSFGDAMMIL